MKQLIVTADDLGLHRSMTDGAIRAHEEGIVTACSISANGREVAHAIDAVRLCTALDTGIHFTLVDESPTLPPGEVPTLVERNGRLRSSWPRFCAAYALGRIDLDEVEAELRAQAKKLTHAGLRLVHANGHQHLHMLPGVFERCLVVCNELDIRYIRIARDRMPDKASPSRRIAVLALSGLANRARRTIVRRSMISNESTIGITEAGQLDEQRIVQMLATVDGVVELVTHPGTDDEALNRAYPWGYSWRTELEALCSEPVRSALASYEIELTRPSCL